MDFDLFWIITCAVGAPVVCAATAIIKLGRFRHEGRRHPPRTGEAGQSLPSPSQWVIYDWVGTGCTHRPIHESLYSGR